MNLKEINIKDFDFLKPPKEKITFIENIFNNKHIIYFTSIGLLTALMFNHVIYVTEFITLTSYLTSILFLLLAKTKIKSSLFICVLYLFLAGIFLSLPSGITTSTGLYSIQNN